MSEQSQAYSAKEQELIDAQDWMGLIQLTRDLIAHVGRPEEKQALWRRLTHRFQEAAGDHQGAIASDLYFLCGRIWAKELGREDLAMQCYLEAFERDGENQNALGAAQKLYRAQGDWTSLLRLYALELELLPSADEKAARFLEMAEISIAQLGQEEDAVRCVKEALKLVPGHQDAERFRELIERVDGNQQGRFEELIGEAERAKNPRVKARKLFEAAELRLQLEPQDEQLEGILEEILRLEPRNENARQLLQEFYELNERWAALIAFLSERLEKTPRRSDKLEILKRLAYITENAVDSESDSARWHREILLLDPVEPASINFCTRYYDQSQEWSELVKVYESALRMRRRGVDEDEMLFQIAMVLWKKISDYDEAEKYFKRIKLNAPRNPMMLRFYSEYYRARSDWRRLLNTLMTQQS
ncbi:MAG: hypothetical protein VYD19_09535, partial [Myxococcota bacterium]|nr:hypothetical protein [Myxococcota bacterium]